MNADTVFRYIRPSLKKIESEEIVKVFKTLFQQNILSL